MIKLPIFKNKKLFEQAFVHRSYLNEIKEHLDSNERLEFLGDSVLSFIVSKYLYATYPSFNEGILTNLRAMLVNTRTLADVARELEFGKLLKLSKGEEESKGRENSSLLADCFEAFVGALFVDQGVDVVSEFILEVLLPRAEIFLERKALKDSKSILQESIQAKKQVSPIYKVLEEEGPPHKRTFTVGAYLDDVLLGTGSGRSKQDAEKNAATQALAKLSKS
ncbi:MAG: ribonuclease III [Patescibacteria group bacterium]